MNISWFYLFKCIRIILLNNENDLYTRTFTHDVKDTEKKNTELLKTIKIEV